MVTIAIIGILAGIATIGVGVFRSKSVDSACVADIERVEVAVASYRVKSRAYPPPLTGTTSTDSEERIKVLVDGGFLPGGLPTADYTIVLGPNGAVSGTKVADGVACGT